MFQLLEFTEAKLSTLTSRVEKHGEEDKPAVSLGLELTAANTLLDQIDPKIREALYKAVDDQEQLPGVEVSTPVLRCNSFERHTLPTKHEGWTLAVDDGIDDTQPMIFGGCKVDKFSVEAKQGGSIVLRLRVGTSDLDAARSGFLGMHVGQPVWVTLKAPEKPAEPIDGSTEAFKKDHPDATDLFADGEDPEDDADTEGGDPDVSGSSDDWPFPGSADGEAPPQSVTTESTTRSPAGSRTARGREKTKAALAEGQRKQDEEAASA